MTEQTLMDREIDLVSLANRTEDIAELEKIKADLEMLSMWESAAAVGGKIVRLRWAERAGEA